MIEMFLIITILIEKLLRKTNIFLYWDQIHELSFFFHKLKVNEFLRQSLIFQHLFIFNPMA